MKFIVDAQLPRGLCRWLEGQGHEAEHVQDWPERPPTDDDIARRACDKGAIVISKDEDFVRLRLPDRFAFIWLRCGNVSNRGLAAWLEPQWPEVQRRLEAGARFLTLN